MGGGKGKTRRVKKHEVPHMLRSEETSSSVTYSFNSFPQPASRHGPRGIKGAMSVSRNAGS